VLFLDGGDALQDSYTALATQGNPRRTTRSRPGQLDAADCVRLER
jgi:hypothetical protein